MIGDYTSINNIFGGSSIGLSDKDVAWQQWIKSLRENNKICILYTGPILDYDFLYVNDATPYLHPTQTYINMLKSKKLIDDSTVYKCYLMNSLIALSPYNTVNSFAFFDIINGKAYTHVCKNKYNYFKI